jgi:translation elongation factor EF-Tu-like GTPase
METDGEKIQVNVENSVPASANQLVSIDQPASAEAPALGVVKRVFTLKERGTCVIVEMQNGKINVGDYLKVEDGEDLETLHVIGTFMPKALGLDDPPLSPEGKELGLIFTIVEKGKLKNGQLLKLS